MNTRNRLIGFLCAMLTFSMQLSAQQTCPSVNISGPVCSANGVLTANINPAAATLTWSLNGNPVAAFNASWSNSAGSVAGSNGQGTALNQLNMPAGVFVDASGNVFVADAMNYRVMRWSPGATSGVVVGGAGGDGALPNQLRQPNSVWVDGLGNLYVADRLNHRIQQIAPGSTNGVTVAGGNGQGASLIQLNNPMDVFLDPAGNMFVADANNNRVLRYPAGSSAGAVVAGAGGLGNLTNQLNNPQGVCVAAAGNVYVADALNHRVMRFTPGNQFGLVVAGGNGAGANLNQLNTPTDVWVDGSGNLFIADKNNHRIMRWVQGAATGSVIAGNASGIAGAAAGELQFPSGIHFDAAGNLYVADQSNLRVQRFTTGVLNNKLNIASGGTYTATVTSFNGCTVTSSPFVVGSSLSRLQFPSGLALDATGNLFVSDQNNLRVLRFNINSITRNYTAVTGGKYFVQAIAFNGCNVSSDSITVNESPRLLVNGSTLICAGDSARITATGADTYSWSPATGVSNSTAGNVFISPATSTTYTLTAANANGCTASATVVISVNEKPGISIEGANCITTSGELIARTSSTPANVRWFRKDTLVRAASPLWAANATIVAGGNGAGSDSARLNRNQGLALSADGLIFVADALNHRIQRWGANGILGVTVSGGNGAAQGLQDLNNPSAVFMDPAGNLYVADQSNHRVMRFPVNSRQGSIVAGGNGACNAANQ